MTRSPWSWRANARRRNLAGQDAVHAVGSGDDAIVEAVVAQSMSVTDVALRSAVLSGRSRHYS
jgi:hypothetical protein